MWPSGLAGRVAGPAPLWSKDEPVDELAFEEDTESPTRAKKYGWMKRGLSVAATINQRHSRKYWVVRPHPRGPRSGGGAGEDLADAHLSRPTMAGVDLKCPTRDSHVSEPPAKPKLAK